MDYEHKYVKYKSKYLQLKNNLNIQSGGSNDIPIVSLFKSDTCGHCNKFKPTWEELQNNHPDIATYQTFDSKNDNLKFTANNINGVPSILKTHNNETVEYNGDRSTLDLKNWIQN